MKKTVDCDSFFWKRGYMNIEIVTQIAIAIGIVIGFRILSAGIASLIIKILTSKNKEKKDVKKNPFYRPIKTIFTFVGIYVALRFIKTSIAVSPEIEALIEKIMKIAMILFVAKAFGDGLDDRNGIVTKIQSRSSKEINKSTVNAALRVIKVLIYIFAGFLMLSELGYNISGFITGLGISGVVITLAAQDTAKSMIGGLALFIDKPFKTGDYIKVGDYEGTVEDIKFRSTSIRTIENSVLHIPNSEVASLAIINYSEMEKRRYYTRLTLELDTPLEKVEMTRRKIEEMLRKREDIIQDSGRMLNEMSEGNFAIDTECEEVYTGAFTDLLTGIRKMNEEIDTTVRGVDDASGQVLTGSTNLAEAAQSLAEGATDQAASVEEMQATINELTSGIKTTAEELGTAYDEAYKYAEIAEGSRGDMEVLVQAMSRINETSEKIGAIITQIEDIASQTNLLSLNASIEAARAGEAGKGFAVVADQIRNLAEQSAKSAVDSKALIEAAIHEVGDGNMYAEKASTSLREVVDGIQAIADSAKKIKEISIEQADSMEQVEATAERIAEVVQNNSAAAQETSATSEELTAQATTLSGMVSVFKLRQ